MEEFQSILNTTTKSPEEASEIDLAERLEIYLQKYLKGQVDGETDFNTAALIIQASSNIYCKKVQYLYELASNLHDTLTKYNQKDDHIKKDSKERGQRQSRIEDPFCSTEIKVGKNLSCFKKRNGFTLPDGTTPNRSSEKIYETKHTVVPVDLLPLEDEEKGDPFYDTNEELIGNRNDFHLNKCRVTTSGWLLLPTVSPECITDDSPSTSIEGSSSDKGYPGCASAPSSQPGSSQQSDEGIGSMVSTPSNGVLSQPSEQGSQSSFSGQDVSMENIPLDDSLTDNMAGGSKHQQPSTRKALQQLQPDEGVDLICVIRPIEKNNCYIRSTRTSPRVICPASLYCAENLYSSNTKKEKNDDFTLEDKAFANNTKFQKRIKNFKAAIKAAKAKAKRKAATEDVATDEDEVEIEERDTGASEAATQEEHYFASSPRLTYEDFDESPVGEEVASPSAEKTPVGNASKEEDMNALASFNENADCSKRTAEEEIPPMEYNVQTIKETVAMHERVQNWQKTLKPFLGEINKREKFDINMYGSQILEAFDDSNRRQTILFRDFCRGMEKHQIHRYFLSLLPLANVGNVSVANEENDDGQGEDIAITLLSRRMHHMELEDFGHNEGEHD